MEVKTPCGAVILSDNTYDKLNLPAPYVWDRSTPTTPVMRLMDVECGNAVFQLEIFLDPEEKLTEVHRVSFHLRSPVMSDIGGIGTLILPTFESHL